MQQALAQLGFDTGDMYLEVGESVNYGGRCIFVTLMAQGKQFRAAVVRVPDGKDDDQVLEEWRSVIGIVNRATQDQQRRLWMSSSLGGDVSLFRALAFSLTSKGFVLPCTADVTAIVGLWGVLQPVGQG